MVAPGPSLGYPAPKGHRLRHLQGLDGTLMKQADGNRDMGEGAGPMPSNKAGPVVTSEFLRQKA